MSDYHAPILSAVRTPIGKFGGSLSGHTAVELGTIAAAAALERAGLDAGSVDLLIAGHARQAANGPNPARQVAMATGMRKEATAWTLNQACASGLAAIDHATKALRLGEAEVVLALGMESMSRVPYYLENARWGLRLGHQELVDAMYRDGFFCPMAGVVMGETAETLVDDWEISRAEQDEFAANSQRKCQAAREAGKFRDEIVGVKVRQKKKEFLLETDEHPRDGMGVANLAKLRPVYELARREGTITAGNASGITDAASAVLLTTPEKARNMGQKPVAQYLGSTIVGCDPARMGLGPVGAVDKLFASRNLTWGNFDLVEFNEAFAAQVIACQRTLKIPDHKLNVNGGSIALGHPIGCTGNRMAVTLLHELRRRGGGQGLATLCVSGGLGMAGIFRVDS